MPRYSTRSWALMGLRWKMKRKKLILNQYGEHDGKILQVRILFISLLQVGELEKSTPMNNDQIGYNAM